MNKTAIIVVNYHSSALIERGITPDLQSAAGSVIVVDNSAPEARELAQARGWVYIPCRSNLGFGAACNVGVKVATDLGLGRFLFLNPDASLSAQDFRSLEESLNQDSFCMISPRIVSDTGIDWFVGAKLRLGIGLACHSKSSSDPQWLTAACLMTAGAAFESVGGFDESYFLYWEDVDLTYRARNQGVKLKVVSDVVATHDIGGTQECEGSKSELYYRQNLAGRRQFAALNLSMKYRAIWAATTPLYIVILLRRGGLLRKPLRALRTVRSVLST